MFHRTLILAVFALASCKLTYAEENEPKSDRAAAPTQSIALSDGFEIPKAQEKELAFQAPEFPKGSAPYLFFRAVAQSPRVGGYCNKAIRVLLNGEPVDAERGSNRPATATMLNGHMLTIFAGDGYVMLPWAPDFTSTDAHETYALTEGTKAAEYEFYLGGLLQPGKNTLVIRNASAAGLDYTVLVGNVELRARPDTPAARLLKPAPTGPLPVCEPRLVTSKPYRELNKREARILFKVGDEPYEVRSQFSTPDGAWVSGSNPFFEHRRQVIEHGEWIEVRDSFRNRTDQNLPIMQQHTCPLAGRATGVWLAGLQIPIKTGRHANGANPSAFAATKTGGLGLVALNDAFRVHLEQLAADGSITLSDRSFVLKPGATYTAELAIVPVDSPDFWDFVNAARRMLDVNFTLDLMFAFAMKREPVYEWSDETFRRYVAAKSANFIVQSNYGVRTKAGHPARATDWLAGPHDVYRDMQKRVRSLFPDGGVKTGIYFHSFLDTTEANKERFAEDRALDSAGNHITYGRDRNSYMSLYIPTLEEGHWGSEIAKVIDVILDRIGADGVFWDEFAWSKTTYVYSHWDGCSADVDWETHRIKRLKGSVCLLSREFRAHHVKRIMDRGAPLLTNGAPWTRTLAKLRFPAFTETGSISHCRKMLLYTPIALGDHLTERRPVDAYRVMLRALDHGCLYAWYSTQIFPEHKMLTEHMFPITPIEIHAGYVIGRERIVTNRSGLFGWGDDSVFESHVFDRQGRETNEHAVRRVEREGKTYAEVRLPDGYGAAIVRVSQGDPRP